MWNAANARRADGDVDAAIAIFTEEIELATLAATARGDGRLQRLGEIWEARGDLDKSRAFWERALHLRQELGAVN